MANNATKNVTIPFNSQLNMNKNRSLTNSSFNIFNKCNSPIFGGNIHPLHYREGNTGYGVYDHFGNKYKIRQDTQGKWNVVKIDPDLNESILKENIPLLRFEKTETNYDYDQFSFSDGYSGKSFFGAKQVSSNRIDFYFNGNLVDWTGRYADVDEDDIQPGEKILGWKMREVGSSVYTFVVTTNGTETKTTLGNVAMETYKNNTSWFQRTEEKYFGDLVYYPVKDTYIFYQNEYKKVTSIAGYAVRMEWEDGNGKLQRGVTTNLATVQLYQASTDVNEPYKLHVFLNKEYGRETLSASFRFYSLSQNSNNTFTRQLYGEVDSLSIAKPVWIAVSTVLASENRRAQIGVTVFDKKPENMGCSEMKWQNFVVIGGNELHGVQAIDLKANVWNSAHSESDAVFTDMDNYIAPLQYNYTSDFDPTAGNLSNGISFTDGYNPDFSESTKYRVWKSVRASKEYGITFGSGNSEVGSMARGSFSAGQGFSRLVGIGWLGKNIERPIGFVIDRRGFFVGAGAVTNDTVPTSGDSNTFVANGWKTGTVSNPLGVRFPLYQSSSGKQNIYLLLSGSGQVQGISYSDNEETEGVLLTEWGSVDETCTIQYMDATEDNDLRVLYRDKNTGKIVTIYIEDNNPKMELFAGRYLLIATQMDFNCYDTVTGKWEKYASDWNNRFLPGVQTHKWKYIDSNGRSVTEQYTDQWNALSASYNTTAAVAAGFDIAYEAENTFAPSRQFAFATLTGVILSNFTIQGGNSSRNLDIFASSGSSSPTYRNTYRDFGFGVRGSLVGTVYPVTSSGSAYFNFPITGIEWIDSFNGKYAVKSANTVYTIQYEGTRPIALYNVTSMLEDVTDFFTIQSQYYAVVNDYICAISYSSTNTINGVDQIVNVTGMKFVGAFPSVAYFYSEAARAIYAFTGDADLQLFVQTDLITDIYSHMYAPNNEWIYLATNDGLYILTQNNTFKLDYNVTQMFYTEKNFNVLILENGENIFLSLTEGERIPIEIETAYFGLGDMKTSTIDTWYIRLYKGGEEGEVKCGLSTMTDIVADTPERTFVPEWDKNDNCFLRYQGSNQLAIGHSFKIKSDYPIAYLGFSITPDSTALSNEEIESFETFDF